MKSATYMLICEHFYFHPNKEIGEKSNFEKYPNAG